MDLFIPVIEAELTVLDYECTGAVSGFDDEPWQLGLVSVKEGKVIPDSMAESLIQIAPDRPFNPHAPGRYALIRDELACAPTMEQVWAQMKQRLTSYPLCAHNISTEKKQTRKLAPMHSFGPWIDTLKLARMAWPEAPSFALDVLTEWLGLLPKVERYCPQRTAHDALYDAVASACLLEHLLSAPQWQHVLLCDIVAS